VPPLVRPSSRGVEASPRDGGGLGEEGDRRESKSGVASTLGRRTEKFRRSLRNAAPGRAGTRRDATIPPDDSINPAKLDRIDLNFAGRSVESGDEARASEFPETANGGFQARGARRASRASTRENRLYAHPPTHPLPLARAERALNPEINVVTQCRIPLPPSLPPVPYRPVSSRITLPAGDGWLPSRCA